ncbi:MAG: TIR domain-containing protein [Vicinamibacterales bacterium]|nr:TIR domain-containing protein [Vicinamibacterales bacterium]
MRVFISWSGDRSRVVAEALRDWLPSVIQSIRPWMSAHDIDAGSRWGDRVGVELQKSDFGVLCVTPENVQAPWLLFEAGALSRTLDVSKVCPFLLEIRPADLVGPLAQFQAIEADHDSVLRLIQTINRLTGDDQLGEGQLGEAFELWWPKLHPRLKAAAATRMAGPVLEARRPVEEMIAELLALVREQRAEPGKRYSDVDTPDELLVGGPAYPDQTAVFRKGQRVEHRQFGQGIVVSTEPIDGDQKVVVNFSTIGAKTLRAAYARLKLLGDADP